MYKEYHKKFRKINCMIFSHMNKRRRETKKSYWGNHNGDMRLNNISKILTFDCCE